MRRRLKVEARLEDDRPYVIPFLRMRGKWLEQMGFPPDRYVEVSMIQPGLLQIRLQPEIQQATELNDKPSAPGSWQDGPIAGISSYSFDYCVHCIEKWEHERRTGFTKSWRELAKRKIQEWEAFMADHYPHQKCPKHVTGDSDPAPVDQSIPNDRRV